MILDKKIKEIIELRKFTCFWEAFDYLKLANYLEVEALLIALDLFNGDIWSQVIKTQCNTIDFNTSPFTSAYALNPIGRTTVLDSLNIKVYIMTDKANPIFKEVYKAYLNTKIYEEIPLLEPCIKSINMELSTELGIELFKGFNQK